MKTRHWQRALVGMVCAGLLFSFGRGMPIQAAETLDYSYTLRADGPRLVNANGHTVRLAGVNVPIREQFDSNEVLTRLKAALDGWKINCVRLAITPDSWLQSDAARREEYHQLVDKCVDEVTKRGSYIILDNHKYVLPEQDSFDFWAQVAVRYKNHPNVIFGLLNEPHNCTWDQWLNGTEPGKPIRFTNSSGEPQVVESRGFQALVNSIRATGAKNLMTVSGLGSYWAFDLSKVTKGYAIQDKTGNGVMYESHAYMGFPQNYEDYIGQCAREYPVYIGEFGPKDNDVALVNDSTMVYFNNLFAFMEKYQLHFTPWSFTESFPPCLLATNAPSFIPTEFGNLMKKYIAKTLADKPVSFYSGKGYTGSSALIYEGNYTQSDFNKLGFNFSNVQSVKTKESAYQYMLTFYSEPNYTGKSFVVFNQASDLKSLGLSFVPKSVKIDRQVPASIIRTHQVDVNGQSADATKMTDGSMLTKWQKDMEESEDRMVLTFRLDKPYLLSRILLSHAEMNGLAAFSNTSDFTVSVGTNGTIFTRLAEVKGNTASQSVIRFEQRPAQYIRIVVTKGSMVDIKTVRLTEVEAYGAEYNEAILKPVVISQNSGETTPLPDDTETTDSTEATTTVTDATSSQNTETTTSQTQPSQTKVLQGDPGSGSYIVWIVLAGIVLVGAAGGIATMVILKKKKKTEEPENK